MPGAYEGGVVHLVRSSATSFYSHSFEVRELRFGSKTPPLNALKSSEGIFEILLAAKLQGPWG